MVFVFEGKKCMNKFSNCGSCHRAIFNVFFHSEELIVQLLCSDMVLGVGPCLQVHGPVSTYPFYSVSTICIFSGLDLWKESSLFRRQDFGLCFFSHIQPTPFTTSFKTEHYPSGWAACFSTCPPIPQTPAQVKYWVILIPSLSLPNVLARGAAHEQGRQWICLERLALWCYSYASQASVVC